MRKKTGQFDPGRESSKVMTLLVSNGLEFPVVAMVGSGHIPAEGEVKHEEARRFYVGATRATQWLVTRVCFKWWFAARLQAKSKT